MSVVTVEGVTMPAGAASSVAEAGVSPAADVARVRAGLTRDVLLAECLDGVEDAERAADWGAYVDAIVAAASA